MQEYIAESIAAEALELQGRGEDLDALVAALPLAGVSDVLEVGSGTGALTRALARALGQRASVVGLEVSDEHRRIAERLARDEETRAVRFLEGDILDDGVPQRLEGRFDLVLCRYLLMYLVPAGRQQQALRAMGRCARPGGLVACLEADVNFGQERFPPPSPRLARVLARIVPYYREHGLIEWRCGVQLHHHMREAGFAGVTVRLVDGRVIQGGTPSELVEHGGKDVETLIEPCLRELEETAAIEEVAAEWRAYLASSETFLYTPIFLGTGRVQ